MRSRRLLSLAAGETAVLLDTQGPGCITHIWITAHSIEKDYLRKVLLREFVGHTFEVHNGNKFIKVFVQEDMVGHKLGEFSPTRVFKGHSGKKAETPGAAAPAPAK